MNSLKTFMNKVGDRVREVAPQTGSVVDGTLVQGNPVEGFVCPTCFKKFDCPESLEKHYEVDHMNPSANYLCPVCQARLSSQGDLELHYSSNHKEKDFSNHSLELLKDELIVVTSDLREERWHSEELKKEVERLHEAFQKKDSDESDVYIHKCQLDVAEDAKATLSSEVMHLRKQLSEALQHTGVLTSTNKALEEKLTSFSGEKTTLLYKIEDLQTEIESYKHFKEEAHKVVEKLKEDKNMKEELIANIKTCQATLEEKDNKLKLATEENDELRKDNEEKQEEIRISQKNIENLKIECDLIKENLSTRNEEFNGLTAKLTAKEKILEEFQTSIQLTSDDALKPENAQLLQEYTDKIGHLDKQNKALAGELESAIKQKLDAECLVSEKYEDVLSLSKTVAAFEVSLNQTKAHLKISEEEGLKRDLLVKKLKTQNDVLGEQKREKELLKGECKKLESCLVDVQQMEVKIRQELTEAQEKLADLSNSHDQKCSDLEDKSVELRKMKEAQESLLGQFDEMVGNLTSKESEFSIMSTEKDRLVDESNLKTEQIESLQNDVTSLRGEVAEMKDELTRNRNTIESLKQEVSVGHREKQEGEEKYIALIKDVEEKQKAAKETIETLQNQAQIMATHTKEYEGASEQLKSDLRKAVAEANSLKDSYDLVVETNTAYHDRIKVNEVDLARFKTRTTELENDLADLTVNLADAESGRDSENSRVVALDEKVGGLEAELAGLAGDKLELEVGLGAASEERQSLLNRCVSSEKEVERLQQEINLLRRKLEDSVAALHDLGRENQSLQIETNKLAGRKWVEDSEVPNCSRCAKNFTVTNRRHHCRNCGQIFCNDCSSKMAPLESNKKPVRVCDSCYSELSSMV